MPSFSNFFRSSNFSVAKARNGTIYIALPPFNTDFKAGLIKCIVATPTLAAGINLPARRVIVRDVTRYDADLGVNAPISVLEIRQMMGRAGRPKYDSIGEAILLAKGIEMVDELKERYILQDTEPIYSKLSIERALRTHILAAIASGFVIIQPN